MIDFSAQTYQNILREMLARIPNTYDKRDTSPIPTALGPAAWVIEGFYLTLDRVQSSGFVQTAVGSSLDLLSALGGIQRYPASAAIRLGVFNTAVPIGSRFSTINGENSINFIVISATDTTGAYRLAAETPGIIGNEYFGPILPITAIPGLSSAEITDILVPGDDEETDDALRQRLITALNERPFGGNIASYRENILAIDGVGAVQIYPTWNGGGTVKCSILGANFLPASEELITTVQNAIDPPPSQGLGLGLAPIGAQVTIITATALTININASLTLMPGYTLEQVQPLVEAAIDNYLESIRHDWGTPVPGTAEYALNLYQARVVAAIITVTGVINATNVTLNGSEGDISLIENGAVQQVPILGTVTLNA